MKTELSDRYKIIFIVFVSLGVYYPSIFGEVNSVDDHRMITTLLNIDQADWKGIFFPMKSISYYRPVLWLSFFFDRFVFNCSESFMHLHNIVIHTINGVLVFFIVRGLLKKFSIDHNPYVPMIASLLFILHPINTEAVNWISGRTDLLAALFVLLSFLFFLNSLEKYVWSWVAAGFFLMGLLSKEVALGLIAVIGIFLALREKPVEEMSIWRRLILFLPFIFSAVVYFLMRAVASGYADAGIAAAAKWAETDSILIPLSGAIKAFGFYIKKLFVPLPLNFGIIEIERPFYFWFGLVSVGVVLFLSFKKRTLRSFLFLFTVPFILLAIPVAISRMTWTPLAERYLYISSFGCSALIALLVSRLTVRTILSHGVIAVILVSAAFITYNRNIVWQSNLTLFEDTVKKSPNFAAARNDYGIALARRGRSGEAREQFQVAETLAINSKYHLIPGQNMMLVSGEKKPPERIRESLLELLAKSSSPESSKQILERIINNIEAETLKEKDPERLRTLYWQNIDYSERLFEVDKNGFHLYRIGQLYLALSDKGRAVDHFRRAVALSPNEYFSDAARKLIQRLDAPKT